jgi:nitroimidazol reductase NimA-like FMN-containing flavoprotein (pyridoxamine 5'-phosphate oxidase superfamily)
MTASEQDSRELTRAECLALLPTAPFGRLVFTEGALPAIFPVNFRLDPAGIVIRTAEGSSVDRLADGSIVALQADEVDATRRTGWSVTVVGKARTARDAVEVERLAALPLQPWVAGERNTFVVVEVGMVNGRRIGGAAVLPDDGRPER